MDCKQPTIYFDIILSGKIAKQEYLICYIQFTFAVWTTYVSIMGMIYYFKKESMEVTVIA